MSFYFMQLFTRSRNFKNKKKKTVNKLVNYVTEKNTPFSLLIPLCTVNYLVEVIDSRFQ